MSDNQYFMLEDAPDYLDVFPVLKGRQVLGCGQFSVVFEGRGGKRGTVYKLTCDEGYKDFIISHAGTPGLPRFATLHGEMDCEQGLCWLIELPRLVDLADDDMILEREALINAVTYRINAWEKFNGIEDSQYLMAEALKQVGDCNLFSSDTKQALNAMSIYMRNTKHDLLLDLTTRDNFMTDGHRLIITDPFVTVF